MLLRNKIDIQPKFLYTPNELVMCKNEVIVRSFDGDDYIVLDRLSSRRRERCHQYNTHCPHMNRAKSGRQHQPILQTL